MKRGHVIALFNNQNPVREVLKYELYRPNYRVAPSVFLCSQAFSP